MYGLYHHMITIWSILKLQNKLCWLYIPLLYINIPLNFLRHNVLAARYRLGGEFCHEEYEETDGEEKWTWIHKPTGIQVHAAFPQRMEVHNSWFIQLLHLIIYMYMYICIYVYMYICIYVYMYICIYVYMYICIYVYMYIYIDVYMYIYIYRQTFPGQYYIYIYDYVCRWISVISQFLSGMHFQVGSDITGRPLLCILSWCHTHTLSVETSNQFEILSHDPHPSQMKIPFNFLKPTAYLEVKMVIFHSYVSLLEGNIWWGHNFHQSVRVDLLVNLLD